MKRLASFITAGLLLAACIYPIDNTEELTGFDGVAIEGTITVGAVSSFAMYPLQALSHPEDENRSIPASFTVEDDMGHVWKGTSNQDMWSSDFYAAGSSFVDLTDADPSRRYRLHAVNLETNESYVSSWVDVLPPCIIDSVNYITDLDDNQLIVNLNVRGNGGVGCYRLAVREDWEYKADYFQSLEYIPNDRNTDMPGEMTYREGPGNYYCWKKHIDSKLNVFDTRTLSADKVTKPLAKIPRSDERISFIYCLSAGVMSISEDHYSYLEHLATISDYNGSLFSPNPSEMRGNIRNETDSSRFVAGYIGAGTMVQKRIFYENDKEFFYLPGKRNVAPLDTVKKADWQKYYWEYGKRPVYGDDIVGWMWTEKRCIDCTSKGGNKEKPGFWINEHL